MVNARLMYCRPGNLFKEFIIEEDRQVVTPTGRAAMAHAGDGTRTLKGCLADATDEERSVYSERDHQVTHTIVQAGKPAAERGDRLVLGGRIFYVVNTGEAGMLGISTIYYAEERRDMGDEVMGKG